MDEKRHASLKDVEADYRKRLDGLSQMQRDMRDVTGSARSRDGMVAVEVDMHGRLTDLHLDSRIYSRLTPQRLTRTLMELVSEAASESAAKAKEIVAPFLPEGFSPDDDFTKLMPDISALTDGI